MTGLTSSVFASKAKGLQGKARRQIAQLKIDQRGHLDIQDRL